MPLPYPTPLIADFGTSGERLPFRFQAHCAFQIFYASSKGLVSSPKRAGKRRKISHLCRAIFRRALNWLELP